MTDKVPAQAAATFDAQLNENMVRSIDQMRANMDSGAELVLDARAPGRFAGTEPEIRPGVRADKVHYAIVDYFESQGFATGMVNGKFQGFIHGTGHGLGLEIHEHINVTLRVKILSQNRSK